MPTIELIPEPRPVPKAPILKLEPLSLAVIEIQCALCNTIHVTNSSAFTTIVCCAVEHRIRVRQ